MDDFANILQRDFGLRPQGKDAPMTSSKQAAPFSSSSPSSTPASIHRTSSGGRSKNGSNRTSRSSTPILGESLQDDLFFASSNGINSTPSVQNTHGSAASDMPDMYDDVFGGPPKFSSTSFPTMPSSRGQQASASQSYDDIFRMPAKPAAATTFSSNKGSAFPVFDAPLYDDDIFGGVPGIRSTSVVYDDVFSGGSTVGTSPSVLEDLLGVSQSRESRDNSSSLRPPNLDSERPSAGVSDFDELLPGFGGGEPTKNRPTGDGKPAEDRSSAVEQNSHGMSPSDPFDVLQVDESFKVPESGPQAWAPLAPEPDASKISVQPPSGAYGSKRYSSNDHEEKFATSGDTSPHVSPSQSPSMSDSTPANAMHADVLDEKHSKIKQNSNDDQTRSTSSPIPSQRDHMKASSFHSPLRRTQPVYNDVEELVRAPRNRPVDEFWITVEDVKLVTQPTAVPPPSRRPPLPGFKQSKKAAPSFKNSASRHESPKSAKVSSSTGASEQLKRSNLNNLGSTYDDVEEFAQGVSRARKENKMDMSTKTLEDEVIEGTAAVSASSMAMKEAAERARAKLRERVKEEKESPGLGESQGNLDESRTVEESAREGEEKDRLREREERDREARLTRERDDRERRRREKEERDKERLKDRIAVERAAVERATAEARERAAADARQRAAVERAVAEARERAAAEAREKAAAEAREKAAAEARQRAAVERATAEARERAAAEARERAAAEARERAAAEARDRAAEKAAAERAAVERATSEARARAERAAVERALAEARERAAEKAAAEARERAAAEAKEKAAAAERASATREQQRRNENDLEAFFASNSRPGSAPRQRSPAQGAASDNRQSSRGFSSTDGPQRSSTAAPAARKVTPATSTDDWTSLFGPSVSASGEFQEVEGENAERRRARLERHQRTAERAARALSEKNQRDLQSQRDQEERHRAGEILDAEIKRWAAGKEGNLRALLSTLQYVLWPECGWQAVSLTDLITAAAVKKVYRKATLCVHPDKVQQKGATIQQKYVAEKVFDLLKEAWNKFNSEELF